MTAGPPTDDGSPGRARARRIRFAAWTALVAAILLGHVAWLFSLRGASILDSDAALVGGQAALAALLIALALLLKSTPADAIKLPRRASERLVVAVAAGLQLLAVGTLTPALTEDLVRYRVDGRIWLAGQSPYATSPTEWFADESPAARADAVDRLVTYPDVRTIYPPVAEALFALAAGVERVLPAPPEPETTHPAERSPYRARAASRAAWQWFLPLRLLSAAAAVGCTFVLLLVLRGRGDSAWWAVLFAWNPLVVLEAGGMGHVDVAGVCFLLMGLYCWQRRCPAACGFAIALAAGVKPIAVLALPFLLAVPPRDRARLVAGFVVTVLVLFVPAMLFRHGYAGLVQTATGYGTRWEANASLYELFKRLFGDGDEGRAMARAKEMARLAGVLALLVTAWIAWKARARPEAATYWVTLVLLLVTPVVYPWYLTWPLCLAPLVRGPQGMAVLVWSGTAALAYTAWHRASWLPPPAVSLGMYVPVYAVLAIEVVGLLRRASRRGGFSNAGHAPAEVTTLAPSR